jgi:hypothetical protein
MCAAAINWRKHAQNKKPAGASQTGFVFCHRDAAAEEKLFELRLFVIHMLTSHRIELLDDELFGHRFLVFGCRIEMAGAGGRFEFDFFTHDLSPSN